MRQAVKQLYLLCAVFVFLLTVTTSTVNALPLEQKTIYNSGNLFFDLFVSGTCGGSESTDATLTGSNNAEKVWNFFASKGLKPIAIAGIMGNFSQEDSTFDPANKQNGGRQAIPDSGDGHTGFGIAQWTQIDRQAALFAKIREAGLQQYYGAGWGHPEVDKDIPAADIDKLLQVELTYAWEGDTQTKIKDIANQLNATTSVSGDNGSTILFHKLFEGSKDNASQVEERVNDASKWLEKYGQNSGGSCAGVLGGVKTMDDAIPWAMKFVEDTRAKYNPAGHSLNQQRSDTMIKLYFTDDSPVSGGSCWGGTYCGQCTALSGWFVTEMTGYTYYSGAGGEVVGKLEAKGVPTGNEPRPFSIFSYATGKNGHTGVVLGTLANGNVITIENNYPDKGVLIVQQYDIKAAHPDVKFAYVGDKLKVSGVNPTP